MPCGVRMATADGSGIEWDMLMSSTSNGPIVCRLPIWMVLSGRSASRPISASFDFNISAVNGVA